MHVHESMLDDQILIKIDSEDKERWVEHVESSGKYTSVSQLIRSSVSTQIYNDNNDTDSDESIEGAKRQILGEIDQVDKTANRIDNQQLQHQDAEQMYKSLLHRIENIDQKWGDVVRQGAGKRSFVRNYRNDLHEFLLDHTDGTIQTINGEKIDFEEFFEQEIERDIR